MLTFFFFDASEFIASGFPRGGNFPIQHDLVLEAYSWGVGEDESCDGLYCGFEGVVGAAVISV